MVMALNIIPPDASCSFLLLPGKDIHIRQGDDVSDNAWILSLLARSSSSEILPA